MRHDMKYKMYVREISAAEYFENYRDEEYFLSLCRECKRYGATWQCPPLSPAQTGMIKGWQRVSVYCMEIYVPEGIKIADSSEFIAPYKEKAEKELFAAERRMRGCAANFGGTCRHCKQCTRPMGLPCRYPELVRPSLEALGFDLTKTIERLFDLRMEWGSDGFLPPRLHLIGAVFHNL